MSGFIEWLEGLNEKDTKVRAVLRRSLAFDLGIFPPAYPYVEPFVKDETLMAAGDALSGGRPLGRSLAGRPVADTDAYRQGVCDTSDSKWSTSTERRFITLLDADPDQLPHRLRQMIALLKEQAIDFDALLTGSVLERRPEAYPERLGSRFLPEYEHEMETEPANQRSNHE